jgi:hypothetical protein
VGVLRCSLLTDAERRSKERQLDASFRPEDGAIAPLTREFAFVSFCHDLPQFNALQQADAAARGVEAPPRLYASGFGCGDVTSLVNDPRRVDVVGAPASAPRYANCGLVELLVRGWPVLALVTLYPLAQGEELLACYGEAFWTREHDRVSRLLFLSGLDSERRRESSASSEDVPMPTGQPPVSYADNLHAVHAPAADAASWAPLGRCELYKRDDALCALTAHVASSGAAAAVPPSWTLADALHVRALTKGADAAAVLRPLLPRCERIVLLLRFDGEDETQQRRFGRFVSRLAEAGKAAHVASACADGSRAAYLLPPGDMAEELLSALCSAGAALPAERPAGPYLLMLLMAPAAADAVMAVTSEDAAVASPPPSSPLTPSPAPAPVPPPPAPALRPLSAEAQRAAAEFASAAGYMLRAQQRALTFDELLTALPPPAGVLAAGWPPHAFLQLVARQHRALCVGIGADGTPTIAAAAAAAAAAAPVRSASPLRGREGVYPWQRNEAPQPRSRSRSRERRY